MASRAGRATDPYKAVPLKADKGNEPHIRLVKVHRDSSQSSLIHCHFVAYPLAACPAYTALSYTWNCPSASSSSSTSLSMSSADENSNTTPKEAPKQTILLQSTRYTIGQNLYAFLRRVRRDSHDRLYWIDALSINQNDNDERSHQVRLMRDIYSSAARVIVWLGEATPDNYATIHLLEAAYRGDSSSSASSSSPSSFGVGGFGRSGSSASLSNSNNNNTSGNPSASPKIGSTSEMSLSAADKQHIASLYEHEYWSRVWIVQEVICARELVVYWGKRTIRWECIAAHVCGPDDFNDNNTSNTNNNKSSTTTTPTTLLQRMLASTPAAIIIRTKAAWDGAVPLAQLVTTYRHLRSSDVRDKVFGLLGLASDKREVDEEDDGLMQQSTNCNIADTDDAMKDSSPDDEDDNGSSDANNHKGLIPALQADYSMTPEDVFEASCRVAFRSRFFGNHYDRMQFGKALREALAVPFTDRRLDELARQVVGLPVRTRHGRGQRRSKPSHGGARQYNLRKQQKIYRMQQWQEQQHHEEHRQEQRPRRQWVPPLRSESSLASSAASASLSKRQANAARTRVRDRAVKRTERTERYLLRGPSLQGEREFGMSGLNLSDEKAD